MNDKTDKTDKTPVDFEAVNAKLNSVSERARIKHEEEERNRAQEEERLAAEEARLAEEREERLTETAAQLRDQFYEMFGSVDLTDASGTESAITLFERCMQVLSGDVSVPALTSISTPVGTPAIPFDWGSRSDNQKTAIQFVADNEISGKRLKVLETVILDTTDRFFVRNSDGVVIDNQIKVKKTASAAQANAGGNEVAALATMPEPVIAPSTASVPSPAMMPTKRAPAKKTVAKKAAAVSVPAQPSENVPTETSSAPKRSLWARGKEAFNNLD